MLIDIDITLEEECAMCAGTGARFVYSDGRVTERHEHECPSCEGTGRELTELGERILDLVARRLQAHIDWQKARR